MRDIEAKTANQKPPFLTESFHGILQKTPKTAEHHVKIIPGEGKKINYLNDLTQRLNQMGKIMLFGQVMGKK